MLKFKYFFEARKNPEQNPREIPMDALKMYMADGNDELYFISMRTFLTTAEKHKENVKWGDIEDAKDRKHHHKTNHKIGVNPQSPYNTPNGIYCYRLADVKDELQKRGLDGLPFMGQAPFIYLLKNISEEKTVVLNDMQEDDVIEIFNKYLEQYPNSKLAFIDPDNTYDLKKMEETYNALRKYASQSLSVKSIPEVAVNNALQKRNWNDIRDYLEEYMDHVFINKFEIQQLFNNAFDDAIYQNFTSTNGKITTIDELQAALDNFRNDIISNFKEEVKLRSDGSEITAQFLYEKGKKEAVRGKFAGGIYWWFTWVLAGGIKKDVGIKEREPNINKWNKILRDTGYDVIVDAGLGIIHKNEPTQTVFLTKQSFEVTKVIGNYKPSKKGEEYKKEQDQKDGWDS